MLCTVPLDMRAGPDVTESAGDAGAEGQAKLSDAPSILKLENSGVCNGTLTF